MTNKYNISIRGRTVIINFNQSNKNHNILRISGIFHIVENDGFTMKFIKKMERVLKTYISNYFQKNFITLNHKTVMNLDYN